MLLPKGGIRSKILTYLIDSSRSVFDSGNDFRFNELALELALTQYDEIPEYHKWVDFKKTDPSKWSHWHQIIPFPVSLFKKLDVSVTGEKEKVWFSSGTTSESRSRTSLNSTLHYEVAIDRESTEWLREWFKNSMVISLIPSSVEWPHSSLAFMFSQIYPESDIVRSTSDSFFYDVQLVEECLKRACVNNTKVTLFGTSYAFVALFRNLKEKYTLPEGSVLIDTGGYKGIEEEITRAEFIGLACSALGLNLSFVNEYGMSELSSQFWSRTTWMQEPEEKWKAPYWVRTRVVNPVTYEDDPEGVLVVYDLANVWTPMVIQTEDLARIKGNSLWPLGRAKGAVLKGCSLSAEQALKSL